ncbi:trypsin-like peptidase domain-containing protein [Planomonospora sp. ID67723]|uniref:trypsin-like peptidase domain-containing protein n=1 Tax=Planomonospora sp. ID67723 TaxID=2738134 RepID=UPI0018C43697|nr:trypsin-like peptidase domain-containing protein [Planomonospora sp. ID67723]MBG0828269.1 trypsin-like peptidase domain-containing protein [Planomonospora sp. ID67723]
MGGDSARRMIAVAALAVTATMGSLGGAVAEADPAPPATRIAARANPAVQLIETTYSGRVTVPTAAPKKAFKALVEEGRKHASEGRIPSDQLSIAKWVFRKIADGPGTYIGTTEPQRADDVTFAGSCTGWWITPDGYMVTAGHCVQSSQADIRAGFAAHGLADVTEKDVAAELKSLMGAVEPDKELTDLVTKVYDTFNTENLRVTDVNVKYQVVLPLPGGGMNATSTRLPVELVGADGTGGPGKDVALLKLANARNLPTVPLGVDGDVRVGNTLYAVGFPGTVNRDTGLTEKSRLYPAITEGVYSARRETTAKIPYIQAQTPIYGGNSGGPVFNAEGKVIALVSATYLNESGTDRQENQSVFFPVGEILGFLAAKGVTPQESPATRAYDAALDDFFADRYSSALVGFQETLTLYPLHPYAAGYIAEAKEAIAAGRDRSPATVKQDAAATGSPAATPAPGAADAPSSSPRPDASIDAEPVAAESLLRDPMVITATSAGILVAGLMVGWLLIARRRRTTRRLAAPAPGFPPAPFQAGAFPPAPGRAGGTAPPAPAPSPYGTPVPPGTPYGNNLPPQVGTWNPPGRG